MASDGVILFEGRICVLNDPEFSRLILEKDYKRSFPIHPGATKMYHDLRKDYWWPGIKTGISELWRSVLYANKLRSNIRDQHVCFNR